jgi:hypothetical protein
VDHQQIEDFRLQVGHGPGGIGRDPHQVAVMAERLPHLAPQSRIVAGNEDPTGGRAGLVLQHKSVLWWCPKMRQVLPMYTAKFA